MSAGRPFVTKEDLKWTLSHFPLGNEHLTHYVPADGPSNYSHDSEKLLSFETL